MDNQAPEILRTAPTENSANFIGTSKTATAPIVEGMMSYLNEKGVNVEDPKETAEALVIGEMVELTDQSKSLAHDYEAADLALCVAAGVALGSDHPKSVSTFEYEFSGDPDNPYYDIVRIGSGYTDFGSLNVPVPMLRDEFIGALKAKHEGDVTVLERWDHNREFSDDETIQIQSAADVYRILGDMAKKANLHPLVDLVFHEEDEWGEAKTRKLHHLIDQCKEIDSPEGYQELARNRRGSIDYLDGGDWE